ncbi:Fatty acid desaturase 2 [Orchesella cincta]|uniref:Fatty acid desaturase 2 n=1 Tax=Orchesella cincta TaxID=48709 RepID=A0A1D2MEK7_ORCCI|nr:Fatty acid desaturase 2 [Orchesella cincta]
MAQAKTLTNKDTDDFVELKFQRKEILYDGFYYDVTDFIQRHPGGNEIISYFTNPGEDATVAIQQFHARSIEKIHSIMKSFKRRPATETEDNYENQMTKEKNKALTEDFTKLYLELKAEGYFEPSYFHVAIRIVELISLTLLGFHLITQYSNVYIRFLGCFVLSMAQGRGGWIMHEGGHISLTGSPKFDRLIQTYLVGIVVGWSGTYWRRHHSLHHAFAQRIQRDTDVDFTPVAIINLDVLKDPIKDQNFMMRNQVVLAPIVSIAMYFYACFWQTARFLVKHRAGSEFIAIGMHYLFAYRIGFWPWVVCMLMLGAYLAMNFGLSHSHLPVTNKPTHWVEHALIHSADVEQRPWCDWWMGYLNYQIEHHLFPTMPQFRNKLIVDRVRALAQKHGLPYHVLSYKDAVIKTAKNYIDVSKQLRKLKRQ